ncbi:hypothetical protein [Streptomyces roseoviridis]|uniref:Uncharacterized protein n=1 Tax=Streptomyces roseoviridis TaxID=67361 RepID=A0ABV5QYM9_9ACTN
MRITLSTEGRTVQIVTSAKERTPLADVEAAALRLYQALPGPAQEPAKPPIGFAGSVDSDTERAPAPDTDCDDDDEEPTS